MSPLCTFGSRGDAARDDNREYDRPMGGEAWSGSAVRSRISISVLTWLAIVGGLTLLASPVGGVAGFGDVDAGRFYTAPVQWMVDNDITTGTGPTCFSPDEDVTRGQAAAFLWRMEDSPAPGAAHPFIDVVRDWQQDPVSWMFNNDITNGTSPTTYSPDDELTRGQLAALVWRLDGFPAPGPAHPFTDVVRDWQQDPVSWMFNNDITTGTSPTTFSPDDLTTRGQIAAFLHRYKGSPVVVIDPASPFCAPPTTTTTTTTAPPLPSGSAVFHSVGCSGCHGVGGSGGVAPRLIGNSLSTTRIRNQVENGGGGMPAFAGVLSNAEITAVVGYVAGL